jgi:hypothetical protein
MTPVDHSETATGGEAADRRRLLVLAAAALLVELLYVFFISAGKMLHWPFTLSYLNDLAEGFRQRHLHLGIEPDPALLAQPNPFDWNNRGLWYWDVSLYQRHYYLYWGPLPAFLLAVVKTVFRISSVVMDDEVVFWLTTLQLVAGTLFIERAGRKFYNQPSLPNHLPLTLQVLAVLVLGLANPTLYNLARPGVYEAAIVGGQAFVLLGLVFACDVIADRAPRRSRLLAAGACWSCALACRVSLAPAVGLLVVVTALFSAAGKPQRLRRAAVALFWLSLPVAVGLAGLLSYNRLRFDAWLEFGRQYQLTTIEPLVGKRFIRPNLYAYLRRPPVVSCRFPFFFALENFGARAFPPGYELPPGYFVYEQVIGVLRGMPWSWFSAVALVATSVRAFRRPRTFSPQASSQTWAVAATAIAATIAIWPGLMLPSATNRYLGDVVGAIALLSTLGVWTAYQAAQARPLLRRLVVAAALLLAIPSVGVGVALGIIGQYPHFSVNNPPLYQKLVRRLSVCQGEIPPEPN